MSLLPSSLRIAVVRGGPSSEYEVSLKTGANVLKHLSETHRPLDILISKDGTWHMHGKPQKPEKIFPHIDVVFNALHGEYGEDGTIQNIFKHHGVRYTGSDMMSSAIGMNKILSKEIFKKHGLKTPQYSAIRRTDDITQKAKEIFTTFLMPVVVKSASSGSSVGISIVKTLPDLIKAIQSAFVFGSSVIVEEFISGKEATCGVLDDFRGQSVYALVPVEIRAKNNSFFDYDAKYTAGASEEICPGNFFDKEKKMIEDYAKKAHKALGLRHYSRSDFIVSPRRGVYILETNTLPGLTNESLLPKSLEAVGMSQKDFIHHILSLALNSKI